MSTANLLKPEVAQLHRAIGQLKAIEKMMYKKSAPSSIIQQLEAVVGSIRTLERRLLLSVIKDSKDQELKKAAYYLSKMN